MQTHPGGDSNCLGPYRGLPTVPSAPSRYLILSWLSSYQMVWEKAETTLQASLSTLCLCSRLLVGISLTGPCDSQPCQNGGTCIPEGVDRYHCLCPLAFGGEVNCGMYAWDSKIDYLRGGRAWGSPSCPLLAAGRKQPLNFQATFFPHSLLFCPTAQSQTFHG